MQITYGIHVKSLRKTSSGFVVGVTYTMTGINEDGVLVEQDFNVGFTQSEYFIPFEDLTDDIVVSWILPLNQRVDDFLKDAMRKEFKRIIENHEITTDFPWNELGESE